MIRITLIEMALVATPFLLFLLYRVVVTAKRDEHGGTLDETPYQILFLSGAALTLVVLVAIVLVRHHDGEPRDQVYIPPQVVDGEVQPGFMLPREEAIARGLIEDRELDEDFDPDTPNTPRTPSDEPSP